MNYGGDECSIVIDNASKEREKKRTRCKQMIDLIENRYDFVVVVEESLLAAALGIFTILKMNLFILQIEKDLPK